MDSSYFKDMARAILREAYTFRFWALGLAITVATVVLIIGMIKPKTYTTGTLLYADVTYIIEQEDTRRRGSGLAEKLEKARNSLFTRRVLEDVAEKSGMFSPTDEVDDIENAISGLRDRVEIEDDGPNYLRIKYSDEDPDKSFRVLNNLVDTFIRNAQEQKRSESRAAYDFIDEQVENYKRQLTLAEERLKEFKSTRLEGSEQSVRGQIQRYRLEIEELIIQIDELEAERRDLETQLRDEQRFLARRSKIDGLQERIAGLQSQLDTLLLSYHETYPDVVQLRSQIKDLEESIEKFGSSDEGLPADVAGTGGVENPLYEQLRQRLAAVDTELRAKRKRQEAMNRLLDEERERAKRVAENQAELAELVRDNDVTREIYEKMLARKEKARLSMNLDIEGQGVSYRIQEPATFPLKPSGFGLLHFWLAGPFVGLLAALALILVYVMVDPRVRSSATLLQEMPENVDVLGVIKQPPTPEEVIERRKSLSKCGMIAIVFLAIYIVVGFVRYAEII